MVFGSTSSGDGLLEPPFLAEVQRAGRTRWGAAEQDDGLNHPHPPQAAHLSPQPSRARGRQGRRWRQAAAWHVRAGAPGGSGGSP